MKFIDKMNLLNYLLLLWNSSDKSQRFSQFIESNSSFEVGNDLYFCEDGFEVFSQMVTKFEKEEN